MVYSARIVGNSHQPDTAIGIGAHDLICHSAWGAAQLQQALNETSNIHLTTPVRTCPSIVRKLVQGIYSGYLTMPDDVEPVLMFSCQIQVMLELCNCVHRVCS